MTGGLSLGIMFVFFIIIMWQIYAVKLDVRVRYLLIGIVIALNVCLVLFSELRKNSKLLLIFWFVVSGAFLLANRFPKRKATWNNILLRRNTISLPEDYLFTVGVSMLGIEFWFLTIIQEILSSR